jgi:hypothetical protein
MGKVAVGRSVWREQVRHGVERIVGERIIAENTGVEKIGVDEALSRSQYKQWFILRTF